MIVFGEESIHIMDGKDEVVMWTKQEWIDDPEVVFSIANAIKIALAKGPQEVKKIIHGDER